MTPMASSGLRRISVYLHLSGSSGGFEMAPSGTKRLRRGAGPALGVMLALLAGCVTITKPVKNNTVINPVVASVAFRSQYCGNFLVTLDGANVTGQFSPQPPAQALRTATFNNLASGTHTLVAS